MKLSAALAALCLLASASAQTPVAGTPPDHDPANLRGERVTPRDGRELPVDQGALGLQQMLRRLNTRASLMLIVAHPDDEDGGMLTMVSRGLGARVATLTLNRGEGGQNAMTGDFEDALGLLRTRELLAADRYLGVQQMFGTEVDFGFSKTKEESFAKWTHERVLYDAVRAVRLFRPLVIAAVFIGGVTDGHGQHQVSGEIAQEVFNAAGDPKVFPEMAAEGIQPWQPLKVYARVPMQSITPQGLFDYATGQYTPARFTNYVTGEISTTVPSVDVVVHEGKTDPLLDGKSYVQFARIGLGLQKSQIGGGMRIPSAGVFDVSYHRYGSKLSEKTKQETEANFFDGIDTTIAGLAPESPTSFHQALAKLQTSITTATAQFNPAIPDSIAPQLATALRQCRGLIASVARPDFPSASQPNVLHELRAKEAQLDAALVLSLGLDLDATVASSASGDLPIGHPVPVKLSLARTSALPVTVASRALVNARGQGPRLLSSAPSLPLPPTGSLDTTLTLTAADAGVIQRPYFHRNNIETPVYAIEPDRRDLRNAPQSVPSLTATATLVYNGTEIVLSRIVHDGPQPISFVPEVSVSLSSHAQVLSQGDRSFTIRAATEPPSVKLSSFGLDVPAPSSVVKGSENDFRIDLKSPLASPITVRAVASTTAGAAPYTEGYRRIGYGDLPRTNYYLPAIDRIVPVDLKLPGSRHIAYLPGTGDDVPEALSSIGLKPEMLTVADLTAARLKGFDAVILGVRTYAAHPDLHGAPTAALLAYARDGGNVVLQYQTSEFGADDAPFPLSLGRDAERVVDETDPVRVLDSAAALMTTPNKITPEDFNAWNEERGHGFLRSWDDHYTALTETHDPGEDPQKGGLITTQLGKGRWTYCAFAIYRQLPEAVPGAYRLFVNLLTPPSAH